MTTPTALPIRNRTLVIVGGDLATVKAQLADVPYVASIEAYVGSDSYGVKVTIDHDIVNTADAVRRATGSGLPTPKAGELAALLAKRLQASPANANDTILMPTPVASVSATSAPPSAPIMADIPEREPLSATFTPLPPANRTLPAPRIEVLRLPVDVVIVPDELVEIYNIAGDVVTTTIGYFLDRPGSDKHNRDPLGVFSQPAQPSVRLPDGVYGGEFVAEVLQAETFAARADRAMRIVSEAESFEDVLAGIDAATEAQPDADRKWYHAMLLDTCEELWRAVA